MATWRYKISLLVLKKYFTGEPSERVKYFSTLEEKFRISARPCNILYLFPKFSVPDAPPTHLSCNELTCVSHCQKIKHKMFYIYQMWVVKFTIHACILIISVDKF